MEQRWNSDIDDIGEGDHRCCVIDNSDAVVVCCAGVAIWVPGGDEVEVVV